MRALGALFLVACGGITVAPQNDASSEATTGCPNVGAACTQEGATCGDKCVDPCSFCNILRCTAGTWMQEEAPPGPICDDGGATCSYPPANNDPACPASFSYTSSQQPCAPAGLTCAYPGAGDALANGCFATAMMWCKGDGGTGTWTSAQ